MIFSFLFSSTGDIGWKVSQQVYNSYSVLKEVQRIAICEFRAGRLYTPAITRKERNHSFYNMNCLHQENALSPYAGYHSLVSLCANMNESTNAFLKATSSKTESEQRHGKWYRAHKPDAMRERRKKSRKEKGKKRTDQCTNHVLPHRSKHTHENSNHFSCPRRMEPKPLLNNS